MKPIRVLHLMNGFGDSSICWIVHRLIQHSDQDMFEWHVSGLSGSGTMQAKFNQLGACTIDFSQPMNSSRYMWQRIRGYLLDHKIHIIHTHTPQTIYQASLATSRIPSIIHISTKHLLTTPRDRRWGLPIAIIDRLELYLPHHLVSVSQTMYRQIVTQPGIMRRRVTAIRNAIPVDKFYVPEQRETCRRELHISPEMIAVGFTGRMEKVKRIDLLIYAHQQVLSKFPNTRLVLVGEGSKREEWKLLAERLGISHAIIWAGFRTDIPRVLSALDVYVVPSVNEGLSLSILEAMAAGKPIIATDVGGTSEVIVNNKSGILVSPGSYQLLANAIIGLLECPEKRIRLSHAGRKFVVEEFNIKRMTNAYCELYSNLIGGCYTAAVS